MRIADLIRPDCIKSPLTSNAREGAIQELAQLLVTGRVLDSAEEVVAKMIARESQHATDFLPQLAFPHASSHSARARCIAVGKFARAVDWKGISGQNVDLVFLIVWPDSDRDANIQILHLLVDLLNSELVRGPLINSENATDLYNTLISIGTDFLVPDGFQLQRVLRGAHKDVIHSLAWSVDGRRIASGGAGVNSVRIWDANEGKLLQLLDGHDGPVYGMEWSPDGKYLATASADTTIRLWNSQTLKHVRTISTQAEVYGLTWSRDGKRLASTGHIFMARLWDVETGAALPGVQGGINIGYCIAWSPDGRWLAAGGGRLDPCIRIWDAATGQLAMHHVVASGAVFAIKWSKDGNLLVAGASQGAIHVFRGPQWQEVKVLSAHKGQLTALTFSCDGEFVASKGDDGAVRIWRSSDWSELACLPETGGFHRLFNGLAFHPRESRLATLGDEGKAVRIWELDWNRISTAPMATKPQIRGWQHELNTLAEKAQQGEFDVFLCHNSQDKEQVLEIGRRLKDRNILPWLDEWVVPPGRSWLEQIQRQMDHVKSAAVFIGKNGLGPWQEKEVDLLILQLVHRNIPIIPVILRGCPDEPHQLPPFLRPMQAIDFRKDDQDEALARLIWGITGIR